MNKNNKRGLSEETMSQLERELGILDIRWTGGVNFFYELSKTVIVYLFLLMSIGIVFQPADLPFRIAGAILYIACILLFCKKLYHITVQRRRDSLVIKTTSIELAKHNINAGELMNIQYEEIEPNSIAVKFADPIDKYFDFGSLCFQVGTEKFELGPYDKITDIQKLVSRKTKESRYE